MPKATPAVSSFTMGSPARLALSRRQTCHTLWDEGSHLGQSRPGLTGIIARVVADEVEIASEGG